MSHSQLSRRHVVIGLAASTAAGTAAQAAEHEQQEVQELLELASRLPAADDRHRRARGAVQDIVNRWMPEWPEAPKEAIRFTQGSELHRDILGAGIEARPAFEGWPGRTVNVARPEALKKSAAWHASEADRLSRTKSKRGVKHYTLWAKQDAAGVKPARRYWAEVERIKEASGIKDAKAELTASREDLQGLVAAILAVEEKTLRGLAIKAEALSAWHSVDYLYVMTNPDGARWSQSFAEAVLRHARA